MNIKVDGAAATVQHDLSEPPSVPDDHLLQSINEPPTCSCIRAAGILRYTREADNQRMILTTTLPAPLTGNLVVCEYCGKEAKPSLDQTRLQQPETTRLFCCAPRQQLCEMLEKQRCHLDTGTQTSSEMEQFYFQGRQMEDPNKRISDVLTALGEQSEPRVYEDISVQLPEPETFAPESKVCRFRLSRAPGEGCWTTDLSSAADEHLKIKEDAEQELVPLCDHKPLHFGMCYHQDGSELFQRNYSSGMKFLTVFPDGSAQVLYPRLLAVIVVVTEDKGRVCIVYDDSDTAHQPIRAVFQSDGRATCYHNNGNIWLNLNRSGGQCLDEEGAKVCRWSWSSLTSPHPIFLALNKAVGVRVLGREQVFVSFLARGQQAKFNVGPCCTQDECKTDEAASGPSVLKEEPFVLAARFRLHQAIQHLHQYLWSPSRPWPPKTK